MEEPDELVEPVLGKKVTGRTIIQQWRQRKRDGERKGRNEEFSLKEKLHRPAIRR